MSNRTIIICFLVAITQLCYSQEMGIEEVKRMAIDVLNIQQRLLQVVVLCLGVILQVDIRGVVAF